MIEETWSKWIAVLQKDVENDHGNKDDDLEVMETKRTNYIIRRNIQIFISNRNNMVTVLRNLLIIWKQDEQSKAEIKLPSDVL